MKKIVLVLLVLAMYIARKQSKPVLESITAKFIYGKELRRIVDIMPVLPVPLKESYTNEELNKIERALEVYK